MPLDPSIYQNVGRVNVASDIADAMNQYTQQKATLAQLAGQQRMQGYQERALERQEKAYPAQQEQAQRAQMEKIGRDIDLGIASRLSSGIPKEQVMTWAQQAGLEAGLPSQHIEAGILPMMQISDTNKLIEHYKLSAMPQEYAKAELEAKFRNPQKQAPSALANLMAEREQIARINPQDQRLKIYDQMIEKTTTQAPQMQIVTSEGGGMQAVTLPKTPGQRATVQSLGIQAVPKAVAPPKQDIVKDATESNALLDQVEKTGALATGSGLGAARDISASMFGVSTEGAKAAAKLKVLGASLTAKVPKMSGPQSDKDVAMYKEAAGNIAEPNIPWETKQAAIQTIREINNRQLQYAQEGKQQSPAQSYEGDKEARYQAWKARQGK